MNRIAIEAAQKALDQANEAFAAMQIADSFEKFEGAWTDFLTKANRVYTKLEQGAKANGKSFAWFGGKKHERKQDQLLRYIKNAREADEHGLAKITERSAGGVGINFPGPGSVLVKRGIIGGGRIELELEDPTTRVAVTVIPASVKLIEVTNYGDRYEPPLMHKGQPIRQSHPLAHPHPIVVAELTISHLTDLIAEAVALNP
jgi:hypothetical protein